MNNEQIAEMLKSKILDIESSKKDKDQKQRITTVHIDAETFLKMAYLFVGFNQK